MDRDEYKKLLKEYDDYEDDYFEDDIYDSDIEEDEFINEIEDEDELAALNEIGDLPVVEDDDDSANSYGLDL